MARFRVGSLLSTSRVSAVMLLSPRLFSNMASRQTRRHARYGHADVAALLIDKGARGDVSTTGGWTPLTSASSKGHKDVVGELLEKGASMDEPGPNGASAMQVAYESGFPDVAKLLLDRGASTDVVDNDGDNVLLLAAENGPAHREGRFAWWHEQGLRHSTEAPTRLD
jgi:hypothetical protein